MSTLTYFCFNKSDDNFHLLTRGESFLTYDRILIPVHIEINLNSYANLNYTLKIKLKDSNCSNYYILDSAYRVF